MAEAAITEQWNKADLEAYVRYTELTDKEKAELEKGKQGLTALSRSEYRIVSRSFVESGFTTSEIRIHSPIRSSTKDKNNVVPFKSSSTLLGLHASKSAPVRSGSSYRHPRSLEGFNTVDEFSAIEKRLENQERRRVQKLVNDLSSLLIVK